MGKLVDVNIKEKSYTSLNGDYIPVLRDLTLTVEEGTITTILGSSGCGKSTMLRIIAGLELPDQGHVKIGSKIVTSPGPDRGFVFQQYSSFPWLTVEQNILSVLGGLPNIEAKKRAHYYLDKLGISGLADCFPSKLSGGEQQRVAIARTFAMQPEVLLMDEPFASLDAQTRECLQGELLKLWLLIKPTILFVTHDISEAALLGHQVVILGGKPSSIFTQIDTAPFKPKHNDNFNKKTHDLKILSSHLFHELTSELRSLLSKARET